MGKDFGQLCRKAKLLVIRNVLAPFSRNFWFERPIEAAVDLTESEIFREKLKFVDLPFFEVSWVDSMAPVRIRKPRSADHDLRLNSHSVRLCFDSTGCGRQLAFTQ